MMDQDHYENLYNDMTQAHFCPQVIVVIFITLGFVPSTSVQVAIADSIVDQIQDCIAKVIAAFREKDEKKKVE